MSFVAVGSVFSGAGGLDIAVRKVFGGDIVWHSEIDVAASKVLALRFPGVPNLGDISRVDWSTVPAVDVLCGGFPCQEVSVAGLRSGLKDGTRSGLWSMFATAIDALRPRFVVIENVRGLLSAQAYRAVESSDSALGDRPGRSVLRAAGAVLGDLADLGYDAQWTTLSASSVGAPHRRERVFIVAHTSLRLMDAEVFGKAAAVGDSDGVRRGDLALLPTPTSRDGKGHNQRKDATSLTGALLPTPRRSDGDGGPSQLSRPERMDDTETRIIRIGNQWGKYLPAIQRWESLFRVAPDPTTLNSKGNQSLNPAFSEWMMGWPEGWVSDITDMSRVAKLRIIGNGVCPQQAASAISRLRAF